jgi:hypothetical protein
MEKSVSDILDAIPPDSRAVIAGELSRCDPALLAELSGTQEPTMDQRDAVVQLLVRAVIKNFGPDQVPNEHGLAIEHAIDAFLEVWPIYR